MKTNLILAITTLLFASFSSCTSQRKATLQNDMTAGDNSMKSVDWPGIYQGTLPCADCEGIKNQLSINKDLTYILETQYVGKSDSVFQEKGKFGWDKIGSKITLDNANNQVYLVGENRIFHLNNEGKRITGDLADKYILEKEKIELTNKYWKLVRLNGKQIEASSREPFVRFTADENRVNGNSSCNMFNGKYELLEGNRIKFSPFAMTKMACIGNTIEEEFMKIFEKTTSYSLTLNELILQDEYETTLAKFEADYFK
ncbi:MAG TPA: copper resistance protein NlpE N-terminal domain-containing protein [Draconibacterium sp.]|nr:copper resistance protein NlpE N-terminal domain-containing protein [Draconibacterium sp.]